MTPVDILCELLTHLGNNVESKQYILDSQLRHWPEKVRHALIDQKFIGKTNQAKTITCHGCNRYCNMPVDTLQTANNANTMQAIICDKRADMCIVPIEPDRLKQWVLTPQRVAKFLSRSLHVTGTLTLAHDCNRYHLGIMKGRKRSHGICYDYRDQALLIGEHTERVMGVISFYDSAGYCVDVERIQRLADSSHNQDSYYTPDTSKRERNKQQTQEQRATWHEEYLKLKKKNPKRTKEWIAKQIAKGSHAKGKSAATIKRWMMAT